MGKISPDHYKNSGLETINVIEAWVPDPYSYCMGNVLKYLSRADKKEGESQSDDLGKALWYFLRAMENSPIEYDYIMDIIAAAGYSGHKDD